MTEVLSCPQGQAPPHHPEPVLRHPPRCHPTPRQAQTRALTSRDTPRDPWRHPPPHKGRCPTPPPRTTPQRAPIPPSTRSRGVWKTAPALQWLPTRGGTVPLRPCPRDPPPSPLPPPPRTPTRSAPTHSGDGATVGRGASPRLRDQSVTPARSPPLFGALGPAPGHTPPAVAPEGAGTGGSGGDRGRGEPGGGESAEQRGGGVPVAHPRRVRGVRSGAAPPYLLRAVPPGCGRDEPGRGVRGGRGGGKHRPPPSSSPHPPAAPSRGGSAPLRPGGVG